MRSERILGWVERLGNRLPEPAALFVAALVVVWVVSLVLAPVAFAEIDPRSGQALRVENQLSGKAMAAFLSGMVGAFTGFPPLGVVLVAMLGAGVAEHTGFLRALLRAMLSLTPRRLLTPMLLLVSILSHSAADAGFVVVIPLGGILFQAAGRHPLLGIACAFAGVSGGFGANFLPSALDPLLQGFTQAGAQLIDPGRQVNPLCNWSFAAASSVLLLGLGWWLTDRVVEPRLRGVAVDAEPADPPAMDELDAATRRGLVAGLLALGLVVALLALWGLAPGSALRSAAGRLTTPDAPLMRSIVPLIFLLFLVPGVVHGIVAGTVRSHRDVIAGMTRAMSDMSYYLVLAFFAALFTKAFADSNLGALVAIKGAGTLEALAVPPALTVTGIVLLSAGLDLFVGSASAKWAILAPIFVPMLMRVGISPELTQAAYRVGDSCVNIVTPLMSYFPLIVVYARRYVKRAGIGTVVSLMLPYSVTFLAAWTAFLLLYWWMGLPLGLGATYTYP